MAIMRDESYQITGVINTEESWKQDMNRKNTTKIILGIAAIFITSIIIIPLSALIVRMMVSDKHADPFFIFDFTKALSIYDMLFLYFTIVGIGVTGLLTWAIFAFSQQKELDATQKRRMWVYSEILFLLNQIFQYQEKRLSAFTISSDWMERVSLCHEFLSNEQYTRLMEFYGKSYRLMAATYAGEDIDKLSEEILDEVLLPFYKIYKYDIGNYNISDVSILLRLEYVAILNAIYPNKKDNLPANQSGKYNNGNNCYIFDKQKEVYKVWNYKGELLCDATIKDGAVRDGYAILKAKGNRSYKGFFVNGERNGNGMEYIDSGTSIKVTREGDWKDNILINGVMRNVRVGSEGKKANGVHSLNFIESDGTVTSVVNDVEVADYNVQDGILRNEANIRKGKRIL